MASGRWIIGPHSNIPQENEQVRIDREASAAFAAPEAPADEVPMLERGTRAALALFIFAGLSAPAAVAIAIAFY